MEKTKYFVMYQREYAGDGSTPDGNWYVGSILYDDLEDAIKAYEHIKSICHCFLCETIHDPEYGIK